MKEDDNNWPQPDRVGRQELEIVMGNEHICFTTSKIGSLVDVQSSNDPEGLRIFYYLVQVTSLFLPLIPKLYHHFTTLTVHWLWVSFVGEAYSLSADNGSVVIFFLFCNYFCSNIFLLKHPWLQDLKCLVFSLISLHFKIKPI